MESLKTEGETLKRLFPSDCRRTKRRREGIKWLRVLYMSRIIKREDTQNVAWFESDSRLLDKLRNTVLGCNQRHVRFFFITLKLMSDTAGAS